MYAHIHKQELNNHNRRPEIFFKNMFATYIY